MNRFEHQRSEWLTENGKQLGVFITAEAIRMARSRGYDLVEVAPTADPPVCRLSTTISCSEPVYILSPHSKAL